MDSQVLLHVPPENPNPGPNDMSIEMNPKSAIKANIAMLAKIMRKPTICALSPSDFSIMIFSRACDKGHSPFVGGKSLLCGSVAEGTELLCESPKSPGKKTVFSDLIPNANENQTIEPRNIEIDNKPMQHVDHRKSGSTMSPSSYFTLKKMVIAKMSSMALLARIAGPANFFQLIHPKGGCIGLQ
tara:strand:- start:386 stop:940 length:555 start_codon:yes stop_codon:yes gene_type:complete